MASLGVDSLFTNTSIDETINICIDNLYNDNENPPCLTQPKEKHIFTFKNKYYKHVDGVAMGFPLGPALANIFMFSFENNCLQDFSNDFEPVFCRCYVDDIFALSSSPDHVCKFKEYQSSKHLIMKFSTKKMVVFLFQMLTLIGLGF